MSLLGGAQAVRLCCRQLILAQNGLTALPPGIGSMAALTTLSVAENRLEELPDDILAVAATLTQLDARSDRHRSGRAPERLETAEEWHPRVFSLAHAGMFSS